MKQKLAMGMPLFLALAAITAAVVGFWPGIWGFADLNGKGYRVYLPSVPQQPGWHDIGPDGGAVTPLAQDPKNSKVIYIGTWGAGVYKSRDGGLTWRTMSNGLENLFIQSLAVNPLQPEIIFAGTYRSGVYESVNGGQSWVYSGEGLNRDAIVYALAIDPSQPETIYAGTRSPGTSAPWGGGVYKSTDGGKTWINHTYNLGEDWVYSLAIDPDNPQVVYAACHEAGFYKSTNGGHGWTAINNGISDKAGRAVAIDPTNSQVIYGGTWHGGSVYKTTNGGSSWTAANSGLSGAKIISIAIDPVQPRTVYAMSYLRGLYKSDNGAGNWYAVGLSPDYVFSLTVDTGNRQNLLVSAVNDDLFRSASGGASWVSSSSGLHATTISAVVVDPAQAGVIYAAQAGQGVARSADNGSTWQAANAGLNDKYVLSLSLSGNTLYAGTNSGGIFKTTDGGQSWQEINNGLPQADAKTLMANQNLRSLVNLGPQEDFLLEGLSLAYPDLTAPKSLVSVPVLSLAASSTNPDVLYAGTGGSGVYRTTNGGSSWQSAGLGGRMILALAVDRSNSSIIYAGSDSDGGTLWKSQDGGQNWSQVQNGVAGMEVRSLSLHPLLTGTIFAATSSGVYSSTNGGSSWALAGLSGKSIKAVLAHPYSANTILAGTAEGVFQSNDGGKTWLSVRQGLINPDVRSLAVGLARPPLVFAGTLASGVYRMGDSNKP